MRKGQIQIIFTWIFILILASAILFYGIKTVKKTQELGNEAVIINFFKNLDSRINTYYYLSKDSSGVEEFNLPSDVKCVCFTKGQVSGSDVINCGNEKTKDYINKLLIIKKYNTFLISDTAYQQSRENIKFLDPQNNICVKVDGGLLKIKLENIGINGVDILNA